LPQVAPTGQRVAAADQAHLLLALQLAASLIGKQGSGWKQMPAGQLAPGAHVGTIQEQPCALSAAQVA
jgi:hypothetical protein